VSRDVKQLTSVRTNMTALTFHFKPPWSLFVDAVFVALVAELRMLSSGDSGSAVVNTPTIVKTEHTVKSADEPVMPSLLEPGMLFHEAYPESVVTALKRLVFDQPTKDTDTYRWKSLGYWLFSQLVSSLKSSDILSQTVALKVLLCISTAFLDSLHGIRQRYFVIHDSL